MSEARAVLKNTVTLGASKVIERCSTIALSVVVARTLGAAALGTYSAAMVFFNLIFLAAEMGSNTYIVREVARTRSLTSRYLVHLTAIAATSSVLGTTVVLLIVPHLGYSSQLKRGIYLAMLAVLPCTTRVIQEGVFVAHQRVEFITVCSLLGGLTNVGVSLVLLHLGYGVLSLIVAFVTEQFGVSLLCFIFISRCIAELKWEFDLHFALRILKEVKAFAGMSMLCGLLSRPEILILSFLTSDAQIGYYSAALRAVDLWQLIPQTYMQNVYPVLSRYHVDVKSYLIRDKSIKYLLAISLPLAAGTIVLARPLIQLVFGKAFAPAVPLLRLLAFSIPLVSLWTVLWRVLAARGRQGAAFRAQAVATASRVLGGAALILVFGVLGAAIAPPATQLLTNVLLLAAVREDGTQVSIFQLSWRPALAAGAMAFSAALLLDRLQLWMLVPTAVIVYLAAIAGLGVVSRDDFALFRVTVCGE